MITGIIGEFNPFHNGHRYILQEAKKRTKCDYMIVAMSGDFIQRGAPAIIDKAIRVKAALNNGADLVLQIPVVFSTATAELFALGAVALLHEAGVDTLAFGCETDDKEVLRMLADFFVHETPEYSIKLRDLLKEGKSYPAARAIAAASCINDERVSDILDGPNNILAIEYIKAMIRLNLNMRICPIKRAKVGHHALVMKDSFASATALRKAILSTDYKSDRLGIKTPTKILMKGINAYIPKNTAKDVINELYAHQPISEDNMTLLLKYKLLSLQARGVGDYLEGTRDLSNRIYKSLDNYDSISELCAALNTKEMTYARLSRLMMHIILGIKQDSMDYLKENPIPYIRVLGFRRDSSILLGMLKENSHSQIITSVKEAEKMLDEDKLSILEIDTYARELFKTVVEQGHSKSDPLHNDYTQPLIII